MPRGGYLLTDLGRINFELFTEAAPESSKAFIDCIEAGLYTGGQFIRSVRTDNDQGQPSIEVIQAMGSAAAQPRAVPHEPTGMTGLRHRRGTISLPRLEPGTATGTGFFVCINDTPALDQGGERNADLLGFAAFGTVTAGMHLVEKIHLAPCNPNSENAYMLGQILEQPVLILKAELY